MKINYLKVLSAPIKIRKLKLFLLFILIAGGIIAQNQIINLPSGSLSIQQIFKEIEKQTNLSIDYNQTRLNTSKKIILHSNGKSVSEIMNELLADTGFDYVIQKGHIIIKQLQIPNTPQETIQITGKVLDKSGEPIIGANVFEKRTKNGAITDVDGNFSINAQKGDIIIISYVGFLPQEIKIENQQEINVTLIENDQILEEVVVVGYGVQKKSSLTGSVSQIDNKELLRAPLPNISQTLAGKLPGLVTRQDSGQPGYDNASVYIRGVGTWGDSTPMILVDGVERPYNNLDPNEIESIAILKDASAASVYGVKGANGVILVTTKRGVAQKPLISYSGSLTLGENIKFPEFLNGEEFAYWYNYAEEINGREPLFSKNDVDKIVNGDPDGYFGNTNWYKKLFKTAVTHQHNLSVNGGSDKILYFLSLGYLDQEGTVKNVSYNRYNLRSNVDAKITNDFTVSMDLSGRVEDRYGLGVGDFTGKASSSSLNLITMMMAAHPYINAYDNEGMPLASSLSIKNPLAARDQSGTNKISSTFFNGSLAFKYNPSFLKGLALKFTSSYDLEYQNNKKFFTPFTLNVFDPRNKSVTTNFGAGLGTDTQLTEGSVKTTRVTFQEQANYMRTFNEKHNLNILFVAEQSTWKTHGTGAYMRGFDFKELPDFNFGKESPDKPTGYTQELPRVGFVGRINYDYEGKYLVEVSSRADASSAFSKENRWGYFPAMSLGWRISEESFIKNKYSFIDNLKLRFSAGILGNDRIESFQYLRMMSISVPGAVIGGKPVNGLYTNNVPNYDITWEKSYNYNVGFDLRLWKGLLSAEFDVFYKKTKDILTGVASLYPPSMGGNYPSVVNMGIVDNRGFELTLEHTNKVGAVSYWLKGNLSYAKNRILRIDESDNIPDYLREIGNPIGQKYGFIYDGLFQSDEEAKKSPIWGGSAKAGDIKYRDINGDGKISYDQDRVVIGKSNIPEMMFGLNVGAQWKDFDISAFFQGAAICDIALMGYYPGIGWDDTQFTRPFYNNANTPRYLVKDAWTPTNTNAKYPRLDTQFRDNNNAASSLWVEDGSYLRLKTVQIGYNLPNKLLKKYKIEGVRLYLAGSNLFTLSGIEYLDPESPDVNNGYYPQQRTYSFGVNLSF